MYLFLVYLCLFNTCSCLFQVIKDLYAWCSVNICVRNSNQPLVSGTLVPLARLNTWFIFFFSQSSEPSFHSHCRDVTLTQTMRPSLRLNTLILSSCLFLQVEVLEAAQLSLGYGKTFQRSAEVQQVEHRDLNSSTEQLISHWESICLYTAEGRRFSLVYFSVWRAVRLIFFHIWSVWVRK